jgi:hypothetical protein
MEKFELIKKFKGYNNKEDKTTLPAGVLVPPSQNVIINTSGRIEIRKGYEIDGQADTTLAPILSATPIDGWVTHFGTTHHLRAGNDLLQFRYVASAGDYYEGTLLTADQVVWVDLLTSTASNYFNFADFWDSTNLISKLLFVNGESEVNEWTGGVANFASATVNTITKQGTTTWAEAGFYTTGTHSITINGTDYQATGGWGTTTLTGVTPDPTTAGHDVGEIVFQKVETTANTSITGVPNTMENDLISVLTNQIYLASFKNRSVYVSKINNLTDFSFSSPRLVGEGALLTLDANPVALYPFEGEMYVSAGKSEWYQTSFRISSDNSAEALTIDRLKTAPQQATQSQALVGGIKNNVAFVSNEPTLDELGRILNKDVVVQSANMSDDIKNDFNSYDFTDGAVAYDRYNIYITVPVESKMLIYNIQEEWWETPQILPFSRLYRVGSDLYAHSYSNPESFKIFTGYNDNGKSMEAKAVFSYENSGDRANLKNFDEFYSEGYIDSNTTLIRGIKYEIDGCATETTFDLDGGDSKVVCIRDSNASLGKDSLGKKPLGGELELSASTDLPPKFRAIKTFPKTDYYEYQASFSSIGVDQRWELLTFGANVVQSPSDNVAIKQ